MICDDVVARAVIVSLTPSNKNEGGGGGGLGIPTTHLKTNSIILAIFFFCLVLSKLSSAVDSYNAWKRHARFVKENSHVKTVPERFLLN